MNNQRTTCDPERIELFLQQKLSDAEQTAFESHLSDCDDCRQRLEATAAGDDIWSGVRDSLRGESLLPDGLPSGDSAIDSATGEDHSSSQATVLKLLAPTDDDRMIGRWGTYEVVGVIGTGGMGVVLKAFEAALNRYVAIKILAPHLGSSGGARKRFSREAQAAAAVVHENVIEIHGVAEAAGLPYLVMPYVRGPSLQRRLDAEGPLALVEILRVGMQAAAGLAAAHAQGLVHRDVKPSNILLADGVERVKLTDFGLARAADDASLTKTGVIAGTPQYMSPEQARGEAVDQRSDLFSLGSVLYAMCTGRAPFRAETSYGVLRRITDDEPRPIREINPEIPAWFCRIVARLMSKNPDNRFQSAREVAGLLEECLAHVQQPTVVPLPAAVPKPAPRRTWWSPIIRFKGVLAMIAFLGAGLLGVLLSTAPPDISGQWKGEDWGQVVLTKTGDAEYTGTFSDTVSKQPGKIELKWSRIERRFNGTWHEGKDRFGELSVRLVGEEIHGALTTDAKSKANPATPRLADLMWARVKTVTTDDHRTMFGPVRERMVESGQAIAFDSGEEAKFPQLTSADRWFAEHGMDALSSGTSLNAFSMRFHALTNADWDTMSPTQLAEAIRNVASKQQQEVYGYEGRLTTFAFQTREGDMGILQITGFTEDFSGVKIRYKLVQGAEQEAHALSVVAVRAYTGNIGVYEDYLGSIGPPKAVAATLKAGEAVHNIPVVFSIPETHVQRVVTRLRGKQRLLVEAFDHGMTKIGEGSLLTVADQIDAATGTLACEASVVASGDSVLLPNTSLQVRLLVEVKHGVTLLPSKAIQHNTRGSYVNVIKPDNSVTIRPVTVGTIQGATAAIEHGLSPGEIVVLDAPEKLVEGSRVHYTLTQSGATNGTALANPTFGPVIERAVGRDEVDENGNAEEPQGRLDLDTGKFVKQDKLRIKPGMDETSRMKIMKDVPMNGADVSAYILPTTKIPVKGLAAYDMITLPDSSDTWDDPSPELAHKLYDYLSKLTVTANTSQILAAVEPLPTTYDFKTREGSVGLLQIMGFTKNPDRVLIRYKLVQDVAKKAAAVVKPAPAADPTTLGPENNGLRAGLELRSKDKPDNTTSRPAEAPPLVFDLNNPPIPHVVSFTQNEKIEVLFHIHNTSSREISIKSTNWRQDDQAAITITDEKGHRLVTYHGKYSVWSGPLLEERHLKPGEGTILGSVALAFLSEDSDVIQKDVFPIGNHLTAKPGRYTVSYRLNFPDMRDGAINWELGDCWRGVLETAPITIEVKAANAAKGTSDAKPAFGPVMERVLPSGEPCRQQYFQFHSGEIFIVGNGPGTSKEEAAYDKKRIEDAGGVDMSAFSSEDQLFITGRGCFFTQEVTGLKWDRIIAEQVVQAMKRVPRVDGEVTPMKQDLPTTYLFKTARGEVGMMEVQGTVDEKRDGWTERGTKFRYKLVQDAGTATVAPPPLVFGEGARGLQAALEVTPGEPFKLRIHIRDVSDHAISIEGASYRQEDECLLTDAQGQPVPITKLPHDIGMGMHAGYYSPGQVAVFESAGLSFQSIEKAPSSAGYVAHAKPGRYTLRVRLHLPGDDVPFTAGKNVWKGVLETGPVTIEVKDPATQPVEPVADSIWSSVLGPAIERTVNDLQTTHENCSLSLDSGKLLPVPANITLDKLTNPSAQIAAIAWAQGNQVDAIAFVITKAGKIVKCGLLCPGLMVHRATSKEWDPNTADPGKLKEDFEKAMHDWNDIPQIAEVTADGHFPANYLILDTRTHRRGVLQIMGVSDNRRGVKIRYRLVEGAAVKKVSHAVGSTAIKPIRPERTEGPFTRPSA